MSVLTLKNVTKSFKDGSKTITALKETNFQVEPGEFVAIIGPSGSGKSTFLTISGGLQTPTSGEVLINNHSYSALTEKKRSRRRYQDIGFILQASNLVPFLTVKQHLELVDKINKTQKAAVAKELLEELEISHLADKLPEELSGGERQRVAIARALYNDPALILADEPTASLDTDRAYDVVKLLAKESKEKTKAIIMVTHDKRMITNCDKVYEMKDGVLTEVNEHL
ncbi:ABC transporter ATP-binding protein [Streptococcus suis]|nr:ABC transporter ATP-binding protein [Streptococcus suis]